MVKKESFVYLFLGNDIPAKESSLQRLKKEFLADNSKEFNFDCLFAADLTLNALQEKILFLPFESRKRIVVIKQAESLRKDIQEFLVKYLQEPQDNLILVLDSEDSDTESEFIRDISPYSHVSNFGGESAPDVFLLARNIEARKSASSLKILHKLLEDGERPERILGGLRARWQKNNRDLSQYKRRIQLFLKCDLDIKTGKAKPSYALEQLVVKLCCFRNFLG